MINVVLAGQLFGTAFACGLNLYATVAVLGIAVRYDLVAGLPTGLGGLGNGLVIGSAGLLYVVGVLADRHPVVGTTWEAVHTLIRPAAASGLAMLALAGQPSQYVVAVAAAAAAVALAAHGSKAGVRLIFATRGAQRPLARTGLCLVEDLLAVLITTAALLYPEVAIFVVMGSGILLLIAGPRLWRAALLGLRAVIASARAFFGRPGWRSRDELPRAARGCVPVEPLGSSPARATAAAVAGLRGVGAYSSGWLVFTCDGPRFIYRSLLRTRSTVLPGATDVRLRLGLVTDALYVTTNGSENPHPFTIFLLKDGPPPQVAAAELTLESRP